MFTDWVSGIPTDMTSHFVSASFISMAPGEYRVIAIERLGVWSAIKLHMVSMDTIACLPFDFLRFLLSNLNRLFSGLIILHWIINIKDSVFLYWAIHSSWVTNSLIALGPVNTRWSFIQYGSPRPSGPLQICCNGRSIPSFVGLAYF